MGRETAPSEESLKVDKKMFEKRHYEVVAKEIGKSKTLDELEENLIYSFRLDNPKFDVEKFREAINDWREKFNSRNEAGI